MENKKLLKKDWQLLTAHALIQNTAYLRTVIENQAIIISHLTKTPTTDVVKKMNEYIKDNLKQVNNMVEKNIPDYPDIEKVKY